ncbi:four helix bundle protein [Sphingobacterium alkalisoli]|uniref:Four helix bundle protein n=1 Tax=Sphingobacterium alkalisoli TaxID=1874115 RepID=A0A4V5LWW3_9SPHI|nr:four helix bundle protein [Sphingobacterium alkalisoli]TJY60099.1 four helix bundle protein [Sphingobacterium alkalisoli]GGH32886.1 hypothetical protein GCM10011418_46720 [Sphingobacterium alkalisoli]
MGLFNFEKVELWKLAIELAKEIAYITANFPVEVRYGLTGDIMRAVLSITANIKRAMNSEEKADKLSFINLAYQEVNQLTGLLNTAVEAGFLEVDTCQDLKAKSAEISIQLTSLHITIKEN